MTWLVSGIALWSIVHLVPALARPFRQSLIDRMGREPYRGVVALLIVAALVMIVVGWRAAPHEYVYVLPAWSQPASFALMVLAFILFGATHYKTAIKRVVRHPMLTSVVVWSIAHLLTNGTTRAIILFGGIGLWALLEIGLINAREGAYTKPEAPGLTRELRGLAISAVIFAIALFLHPYFAGVAIISW